MDPRSQTIADAGVDARTIDHELNRLTLRWLPATMASAAAGAICVPLVLTGNGMDRWLLIWAAVVVSLSVGRWWIGRHVDQSSMTRTRHGLGMIFFLSLLIAASWVWVAILPIVDSSTRLMAVSVMIILMAAGATAAYAAAPRFYFVFVWPVVGALAMRFLLADIEAGWIVAMFMGIFLIGTTSLILANHRGLRKQVELRLRSTALLDEMTSLNREFEGELNTRRRTQRQLIERDEVLHDIYRAVSDHQIGYRDRLRRVLELGQRHFGMSEAALVRLVNDEVETILTTSGSADLVDNEVQRSIISSLRNRGRSLAVADVVSQPAVAGTLPVALGALVAIEIADVGPLTVLSFANRRPRDEWSKFDHDLLEILANWIGLEGGRQAVIEDLRNSEQEMRNLANALPFAVSYCDRDLIYQYVNQAFAEQAGEPAEQIVGQSLRQRIGEDVFRQVSDRITGALFGEAQDFEVQRTDMEPAVDYQVTYLPDTRQGEVVGFYQITVDITQVKREQELLQHRASHDALTGLPNRTEIEYQIQRLIDRRGVAGPHAICYVDLDNFKPINDSIGHHAGDAALRWFAERLQQVTRSSDTVARIGGDEFAILLPGCSGSLARRITDGLHSLLESAPFQFEGSLFSLRTSIGVVEFRGGQSTPIELIKKADAVCYRAKQAGGGRTA